MNNLAFAVPQLQLGCTGTLNGAVLAAYEDEILNQLIAPGSDGEIQLAECGLYNAVLA